GRRVSNFAETFSRLPAYSLCRRVRCNEPGIFSLQLLQLIHELVEFGIRNRGVIQNVIEMFMMADFFAQSVDLFGNIFGGHNRIEIISVARSRRTPLRGALPGQVPKYSTPHLPQAVLTRRKIPNHAAGSPINQPRYPR